MKSIIFKDVTPCNPVEVTDVSEECTAYPAVCQRLACYLLSLLFDPEDGGSTFPGSFGDLPDCTASDRHRSVNLKSDLG
jgi:hypothetical protein